jgi:PAS domain S-box-containing protein
VTGTPEHRTKRARAERSRRDDERFRSLADTAPVILWVTQPDGSCSFLSRDWYEFTGQTESTALGSGWLEAIHPDDRELSEAAFTGSSDQREPFAIEYRLRRHDGTFRWVIDSGRPRFDGPRFAGYVGSVIDVTERKRSEESDARFRIAADAAAAVVYDVDVTSDPDSLAEAHGLENLLGEPVPEDLTSGRWHSRMHPDDLGTHGAIVAE